jgi:hypothetical protein
LARILESDKAENLASLLGMPGIRGFGICGFSSETAIGLVISLFSVLLSILLFSLTSFLAISAIE